MSPQPAAGKIGPVCVPCPSSLPSFWFRTALLSTVISTYGLVFDRVRWQSVTLPSRTGEVFVRPPMRPLGSKMPLPLTSAQTTSPAFGELKTVSA